MGRRLNKPAIPIVKHTRAGKKARHYAVPFPVFLEGVAQGEKKKRPAREGVVGEKGPVQRGDA